ncbi:hypothetical protein TWF730_000071 [Orbilia blumenaviensis]|uniref:Uncharacterized protein n=1 Tax=Orbilia blumenaviensis TaxID=1796055 RepID=A0AAV9VKF5_9PEZI
MTVTEVQTSTFIPTTVISNQCGSSTSTSLQLCGDLLATWDPFGFSSNSTTSASSTSTISHNLTTTTTTITRSSSTSSSGVPTPDSLYTFVASSTEGLDIDSSGNVVLSNPSSGLTAAFILNADGTLSSYGSNINIFADFSDTVTKRAINTAYSLGFCLSGSSLHRRSQAGGRIVIFPRAIGADGKSFGEFSLSNNLLQLATNGSTYGWANCVSNDVSVYDLSSDSVPGDCGAIDLTASAVASASYSQYYSAGLKKKSQIAGVSTCSTSPATSSSISTTSSQNGTMTVSTGSEIPVIPTYSTTNTAPEAGFTSIDDPYPIFAMSALEQGTIFVNDDLQLVMQNANGTNFHAFQLTDDDRMLFYGGNFTIYANTSVRNFDTVDERAICYGNRIVLKISLDGTYPVGATIGPFITDPDVGLILQDWSFLACGDDAHLELSYLDCPIQNDCILINPALFALDPLSRQQALYNGAVLAQRVVPTTTSVDTVGVTSTIYETNAVAAVRNILSQGGYSDFCSSELGLYTTSTVTEYDFTIVATETTEAVETFSLFNFRNAVIEEVTTESVRRTTTTTTSAINSIYVATSRNLVWVTQTLVSPIYTTTYVITTVSYATTTQTTVTTMIFTTSTARTRSAATQTTVGTANAHKRNLDTTEAIISPRTQDPNLTPTYITQFDPSIVASACGLYFQILYNSLGVPPTSFTYLVGETSYINETEYSYTATSTSTFSTSYDDDGTVTNYSFTGTRTSVIVDTKSRTYYLTSTAVEQTTATEFGTLGVRMGTATTTTRPTAGTRTIVTVTGTTTTLCRPTHALIHGSIPGKLLRPTGVERTPFYNFTYGRNIPDGGSYGLVTWRNLPGLFPQDLIWGQVQAAQSKQPTGWAWMGQVFAVCPGTTYYVSVAYKWFFDRNNPQSAGSGIEKPLLYKNSMFSLYISDLPQGQQYKTTNAYDSPHADGKAAIFNREDPTDANRMTNKFTATGGEVGIYFGISWLFNEGFGQVLSDLDLLLSNNRVYLHGFNISDFPVPQENKDVSWFLPD